MGKINTNFKPSDLFTLLAVIDPASQAAGTVTTGWLSAATHVSFLGRLMTGVMGTAATIDAKFQQATDSSGTGAKDVTGSAVTQLVKASNDTNQVAINLRADRLDKNNGFTYIRLSISPAVAASLLYAEVLGFGPYQDPGTPVATLVQVVTV